MSEISFNLGMKLPYEDEMALAILSVASSGNPSEKNESGIRKKAVHAYTLSVMELWSKAFGAENIRTRKTIASNIRRVLTSHFNMMRSKKATLRERQREWAKEHHKLFDILKDGIDPSDFQDEEKQFYLNQKSERRAGYVSMEIDEEYEKRKEEQLQEELNKSLREEAERSYMEVASQCGSDSGEDGDYHDDIEDFPTESKGNEDGRPSIRVNRNLTHKIKSACASVSIATGLSSEMSRKAVQTVCKELYGHSYYLSPEEQMQNEPSSADVSIIDEGPEAKRFKGPITSDEYQKYKYVLPSATTIEEYKGLLAAQEEAEAGVALLSLTSGVETTLHYDTTQRNFINGDWVSIILRFSDKREFHLRPIQMSFENRENIQNFVQETYTRMAAAASIRLHLNVEPKQLWEKTTFFCTDAVSKNHFVGEGVAKHFNSTHVPIHTLCKSHTVEGIEKSNLKVLTRYIEIPLKLRNYFEESNPSLRPFFRGSTIVQAGMKALLKIVTPDKSANSCSLSTEFEKLCKDNGVERKVTLYHERRFAKLGSCAAALLQALPLFETLLSDTPAENLLAQACRLFIQCELFITELRLLAYFNKHVTFPFLNCVEVCDVPTLKVLIPQLYEDLKKCQVSTMKDYIVERKYVVVEDIEGELEIKLLNLMCVDAAECIQLQCGREYGFPGTNVTQRADDLSKISDEKLRNCPTNNLISERDLSVFSKFSVTAKCRNKIHTGESLRDRMVLYKSEQKRRVEKEARCIKEALTQLDHQWASKQNELLDERLKEKLKKAKSHVDYVGKLLKECKTWGGPCTSTEELLQVLSTHPDMDKKIVKTEMSYYAHTHKSDKAARPELFKIAQIDVKDQLENLCILLSDVNHTARHNELPHFPTNEDALRKITDPAAEHPIFKPNEACINVWYENDKLVWYIGYFRRELSCSTYEVEQLVRVHANSDLYWRYPENDVLDEVSKEQILKQGDGKLFEVEGNWNFERRLNQFCLKRCDNVKSKVDEFMKTFQI